MESPNNLQELEKQQIIEEYEQKLHVLHAQLTTLHMMEKELSADNEALQKIYDTDKAAASLQVKDMEEKFSLAQKELLDKIDLLKKDKSSEEETHTTQMLEMKFKVKQLEQLLKEVPDTKNSDMVKELQLENKVLQEKEADHQMEYKHLQDKNVLLTNKISELSSNLNEANECLSAKQEDLASCMNCLTSVQEELAVMRAEMEVLKCNPQTDGQKGNSVFAEVEDKRLSLKKNLDTVVKKYRHLKKLCADKCAEATKFRTEYVFLSRKWDQLQLETKEQEKRLIESQKTRIEDLEQQVQKLQSQKPPYVINNVDNDTFKFVEAYIESNRKECKKLKDELEARAVCTLFTNETLFKTQQELRRKEVDLVHARAQITELQGLLQENKEKLED